VSIVYDFPGIAKRMGAHKPLDPTPGLPKPKDKTDICPACGGDGWELVSYGYGLDFDVCSVCKNPHGKASP